MSYLPRVSSYTAAIFGRTSNYIAGATSHQCFAPPLWKPSFQQAGDKTIDLEFLLTRFRVHCYSSQKSSAKAPRKASTKASHKKKLDPKPTVMEQEKDSFFVVRKGDVVGVYKSFADCQAQVGSSICDPPVSVYKGYSLPKESETYLISQGLQNALYTIRAADLKEDLFGTLESCPLQQLTSSKEESLTKDKKKRSQDLLGSGISEAGGLTDTSRKHAKLDTQAESQAMCSDSSFCILEFDGASKGNPGQAGAGAVLRAGDGSLICKLREGLGKATNNAAEYRAIILGLKNALQKGYTKIRVQGDSKLVCMQVQGLWKVRNENLSNLYFEAEKLKNKFVSFQISHFLREFNSEADAQANLAINLADGEVEEEFQ